MKSRAEEAPGDGAHGDNDVASLRRQLINWLFTPLYLLLVISTLTGYIAAQKFANQPYDKVLKARAQMIATRYDLMDREGVPIFSSLLPVGLEGLKYALYDRNNHLVASNAPFPPPSPNAWTVAAAPPVNGTLEDEDLRIFVMPFHSTHPRHGGDYILILAETTDERRLLGRDILGGIVIPQLAFILIAALAVWVGLRRGLAPLERLRQTLVERDADDLRPLDETLSPREVKPLIHEINVLIARIKVLMEKQREFVANAAHQLRTPFAGLRAQAELARAEDLPGATRDALDGICAGADRCSRLVTQMLVLARNEPDAWDIQAASILDLERLAQEASSEWVPTALAKGIDLGFEGRGKPMPVLGIRHPLRDLIDNLLDNAIRYTQPGGRITVRTWQDRGSWLAVEDNGPGIPATDRERVFERFYRVAGTGQTGSGLGLSIVGEVARRHHATVEVVTGKRGLGSVFQVHFPPAPSTLSV
jgi:two-component system sensor histidine kinase TctE